MTHVFDISLRSRDSAWTLELPAGGQRVFETRREAVRFAAREAARVASLHGIRAYLSIEGEDGVWRLFGPDLKAPAE